MLSCGSRQVLGTFSWVLITGIIDAEDLTQVNMISIAPEMMIAIFLIQELVMNLADSPKSVILR